MFNMADSTLDDIIKQKRQKRFNLGKQNKRLNQNQNIAPRIQGKAMMNNKRGRLYKEVQKDLGIKTTKTLSIKTDARNRIIQAKRIKFTDARDRLAHIAKQSDARDKLNKMRKNPGVNKVVPQQKKTVVKKKITNVPKQAFSVEIGQNRAKGPAIVRTVAGKPRVLQGNVVKNLKTQGARARARGRGLLNTPGLVTIKNNNAQVYETVYEDVEDYEQEIELGPHAQPFTGLGLPTVMDELLTARPEPYAMYAREYEPEIRPSRLRITAANPDYRLGGQQYIEKWQPQAWEVPVQSRMQPIPSLMQPVQNRMQPRKRELYDDQVEYQVYPKKIQTMPPPQVQERGTKVVVSNLHPCVSVEDMEELFGTIGTILSVRMVRQGVAEAMFVTQEDAYRSVDLFNNRQLDGQPMKVMVVRKKALMPTPNIQSRSILKSARGRTGYYIQ